MATEKEVIIRLTAKNEAGAAVQSVKQQLREANDELNNMVQKFGLGSKEAASASQKVSQLRDTMGDAKLLADGFNPDEKFKSFGAAVSGVTAGFAGLQGAMGLFGVKSDEVEKTLLKVQSAMALSQGINGVLAAKDSFIALATVIRTQVAAAFATMKSAIISTGIGALAVVIGTLIATMIDWGNETEEQAEKQKKLNDELERTKKTLDETLRSSQSYINREIELTKKGELIKDLEARGASQKEINKLKREAIQLELEQQRVELNTKQGTLNTEEEFKLKAGIYSKEQELRRLDIVDQKNYLDKLAEDRKKAAEERRKEDEYWSKVRLETAELDFKRESERAEQKKQADAEEQQRLADNQQVQFDIYNDTAQVVTDLNNLQKQQIEERGQLRQWELEDQMMKLQMLQGIIGNFANVVGQQTVAGKALAVASATINTYQAASEALKANYGVFGPAAQVSRVVTVAAVIASGLANVRKIISTQIPGKGGGGSVGAAPAAPAAPQVGAQTVGLDKASINSMGDRTVRAYVVDRDINNMQDKDKRIERAAIFG